MTKLSLNDNTCCKKSRLIIRLLEDSDEQIKQQNIGHQQKQSHDDSHQCATKFIMTGGVESCGFLIYKKKMLENLAPREYIDGRMLFIPNTCIHKSTSLRRVGY